MAPRRPLVIDANGLPSAPQAGDSLLIPSVAALPAASSEAGVILRQGGTLWYSDGTTWADLAAAAGGGGGSVTPIVVTVPNGAFEHYETLTLAGATALSTVTLALAGHDPTDENEADMLGIVALAAVAGVGTIDVQIQFTEPHGGPIRLTATLS